MVAMPRPATAATTGMGLGGAGRSWGWEGRTAGVAGARHDFHVVLDVVPADLSDEQLLGVVDAVLRALARVDEVV